MGGLGYDNIIIIIINGFIYSAFPEHETFSKAPYKNTKVKKKRWAWFRGAGPAGGLLSASNDLITHPPFSKRRPSLSVPATSCVCVCVCVCVCCSPVHGSPEQPPRYTAQPPQVHGSPEQPPRYRAHLSSPPDQNPAEGCLSGSCSFDVFPWRRCLPPGVASPGPARAGGGLLSDLVL